MSQQSRKHARRAAVQREVQKREDALAVPIPKQVFVFQQHFWDSGGPRGLTIKKFQDDPENFDFLDWENRLRRAPAEWKSIEIVADDDPDSPTIQPVGDYSEFSDMMIFSRRAANVLHDILQPCGVFLQLRSACGDYVGYRLDAIVDALDVQKTRATWREPGRDSASSLHIYAFHTERLGTAGIFRIPQHFQELVLHEFVSIVRANHLSGFQFCRIWPTAMAAPWPYGNWC